jgi:ethanolamine ammonia-lyase large subunit
MNHNDQEMATVLGTAGGAVYYMGMSMVDDCMLSYQDTSYHDDPSLREIFGLRPARSSRSGWSAWALCAMQADEAGG